MQVNESQQAILEALANIPHGRVCTYGNLAARAGCHGKSRYVGYILRNLPRDTSLPWHRVINAQGKSSFPAQSSQYKMQLSLLAQEGVIALNGKINLKRFLWQ